MFHLFHFHFQASTPLLATTWHNLRTDWGIPKACESDQEARLAQSYFASAQKFLNILQGIVNAGAKHWYKHKSILITTQDGCGSRHQMRLIQKYRCIMWAFTIMGIHLNSTGRQQLWQKPSRYIHATGLFSLTNRRQSEYHVWVSYPTPFFCLSDRTYKWALYGYDRDWRVIEASCVWLSLC